MKKKDKEIIKEKANEMRENMARKGVDNLLKELAGLPDEDLVSSVAQHLKIKVKLF